MALRLTHVLVLMALILGAGVISAALLAPDQKVPGVLIVDAPWAAADEFEFLAAGWKGASLVRLAPDLGPLGPFGLAWAADRSARGHLTALYSLDPRMRRSEVGLDGAGRQAWRVVVDSLASLAPSRQVPSAVSLTEDFLRNLDGVRPFALGLALDDGNRPVAGSPLAQPLGELVRPLMGALTSLPSFRSSTLVILGPEDPDGSHRLALRIDHPFGEDHWPMLNDLLETPP